MFDGLKDNVVSNVECKPVCSQWKLHRVPLNSRATTNMTNSSKQ